MAGRPRELTPKQRAFIREYLVDLNATAAYVRAGYKVRTDNVAAVEAHKLLRNPKIAAAVAAAQAKRAARTEVSQDWVINRLKRESRRTSKGSSHAARVKALELIGRHVGLWKDKEPLDILLGLLPPGDRASVERRLAAGLHPGRSAPGPGRRVR